jgi:hypothetical protein
VNWFAVGFWRLWVDIASLCYTDGYIISHVCHFPGQFTIAI